jgi:hypothetical protein
MGYREHLEVLRGNDYPTRAIGKLSDRIHLVKLQKKNKWAIWRFG